MGLDDLRQLKVSCDDGYLWGRGRGGLSGTTLWTPGPRAAPAPIFCGWWPQAPTLPLPDPPPQSALDSGISWGTRPSELKPGQSGAPRAHWSPHLVSPHTTFPFQLWPPTASHLSPMWSANWPTTAIPAGQLGGLTWSPHISSVGPSCLHGPKVPNPSHTLQTTWTLPT